VLNSLLSAIAFLSVDDISIDILKSITQVSEEAIESSIKILQDYSILTVKKAYRRGNYELILKTHRRIQDTIRYILQKSKVFDKEFKEILLWMLNQSFDHVVSHFENLKEIEDLYVRNECVKNQ